MSRRGYYTVEAAIFLPIFLLTMLTLGCLIKAEGAWEEGMHAATDEARWLAARAYTQKLAPEFPILLAERIRSENSDVSLARIRRFRFLHSSGGTQGLISFEVEQRVDFLLPLRLYPGVEWSDRVRCRAFIGYDGSQGPAGFDSMEQEGGRVVWVFPDQGVRYHTKECTFVTGHPCQMILGDELKKHYDPCRHCDAADLPAGSLVYCFPDYGGAYHRRSCRSVERYTVTMTLRQAEERGYTPCLKCGGGHLRGAEE